MSTGARLSLLLLSLAAGGCGYRERGRFAAVAADVPGALTLVSRSRISGRACFGSGAELGDDRVIDAALRDALAAAPGADALAGAQITDEGNCVRIEGWPVRMGAP